MANTVNVRTVVEGPRDIVLHVELACDGASGELTGQDIFAPASVTQSPVNPRVTYFSIIECWYNFSGFDATLVFDATTDRAALQMPATPGDSHYDFSSFGGIPDPKASGWTGKIQLTTAGFTAATDKGFMVLKLRKH